MVQRTIVTCDSCPHGTQDQEMAEHQELAAQLGVAVYLCDPQSPWQRGSNENANRLPRQFSMRDLDGIAQRINTRLRRVLDQATLS